MPDRKPRSRSFGLLAPRITDVPPGFGEVHFDEERHGWLLAKLQRLRGRIYLEEGAIESWQLTESGRHIVEADSFSWHLLSMEDDEVVGCARLQIYASTSCFTSLSLAGSAIATSGRWGAALRASVAAELEQAESEGLLFVEAGGWALIPELRFTSEALHIALGGYAIGELLGGCIGLSTATVRHHSASILRRLGGRPLLWNQQSVPPYYDPAYGCEMEVVRFDSRAPSPKYRAVVDSLIADVSRSCVWCCEGQAANTQVGRTTIKTRIAGEWGSRSARSGHFAQPTQY